MSNNSEQSRLSLSDLKPGLVLPAAVFDGSNPNVLLLGAGTRITSTNLQRLRDRGVSSICIDSKFAEALKQKTKPKHNRKPESKPKESQKPHTEILKERRQALRKVPYSQQAVEKSREQIQIHSRQLQVVFETAQRSGKADSHAVQAISEDAAKSILDDMDVLLRTILEEDSEGSSHKHCLRVSQLAMSVASIMGASQTDCMYLSMGCLLSRLGMTPQIQALIEKPDLLTSSEYFELQKVPIKTKHILNDIDDFPTTAKQVAFQFFERHNGTGYPKGLTGKQIDPLARIAAVCDSYVALTSDRPHRKALEPYYAVEEILNETKRGRYDPLSVKGLLQTVSLFPIGSFVKLTDVSIAEVMRNCSTQYDAPVVKIISAGQMTTIHQLVDLEEQQDLQIETIIPKSIIQQAMQNGRKRREAASNDTSLSTSS